MHTQLAADANAGLQALGTITASGIALIIGFILVLGLRGSDTIKINNKKSVGVTGVIFGVVALAAGGAWSDFDSGVHSVPAGALEGSGPVEEPGAGAVALCLALATFGPNWRRMIFPAFFGIALAVAATEAGGYGAIFTEIIRSTILRLAGAE